MSKIYVFWDNSNVFISAKSVAEQNEPAYGRKEVRIQFDSLFQLATAEREVASAVCVGSVPPDLEKIWARLEETGIKIEKYERGELSGKEQGIDQCLQLWMLRALADADEPAVAVLLTGDGKGYEDGVGFRADLERMYKRGWGIEVVSWEQSCKRALKEWAEKVGVYVRLEDYYSSITFLENQKRRSKPLDLSKRLTTQPRTRWQHCPAATGKT